MADEIVGDLKINIGADARSAVRAFGEMTDLIQTWADRITQTTGTLVRFTGAAEDSEQGITALAKSINDNVNVQFERLSTIITDASEKSVIALGRLGSASRGVASQVSEAMQEVSSAAENSTNAVVKASEESIKAWQYRTKQISSDEYLEYLDAEIEKLSELSTETAEYMRVYETMRKVVGQTKAVPASLAKQAQADYIAGELTAREYEAKLTEILESTNQVVEKNSVEYGQILAQRERITKGLLKEEAADWETFVGLYKGYTEQTEFITKANVLARAALQQKMLDDEKAALAQEVKAQLEANATKKAQYEAGMVDLNEYVTQTREAFDAISQNTERSTQEYIRALQERTRATDLLNKKNKPEVDTGTEHWSVSGWTQIMSGMMVIQPLLQSAEAAANFQEKLTKLSATAGESASSLPQLSKNILKVSADFGIVADKVADAQYVISSLGLRGAQGLTALTNAAKLARGSQVDMEDTSKLLARTMVNYGQSVQDGSKDVDLYTRAITLSLVQGKEFIPALANLQLVAHNAGLSVAETASALDIMTQHTKSASIGSTYLRNLLQGIIKPTADMTKAFQAASDSMKAQGDTVDAYRLKMIATGDGVKLIRDEHLSFGEVLGSILRATKSHIELLDTLFPDLRKNQGAMALLNDGLKDYNRTLALNNDSQGANAAALKNQKQDAEDLATAWNNLSITAGTVLIPALEYLTKTLQHGIDEFTALPGWEQKALIGGLAFGAGLVTVSGIVRVFVGSIVQTIGWLSGLKDMVVTVATTLGLIAPAAEGAAAAEGAMAVAGIAALGPYGIAIAAVVALIAGITLAWNNASDAQDAYYNKSHTGNPTVDYQTELQQAKDKLSNDTASLGPGIARGTLGADDANILAQDKAHVARLEAYGSKNFDYNAALHHQRVEMNQVLADPRSWAGGTATNYDVSNPVDQEQIAHLMRKYNESKADATIRRKAELQYAQNYSSDTTHGLTPDAYAKLQNLQGNWARLKEFQTATQGSSSTTGSPSPTGTSPLTALQKQEAAEAALEAKLNKEFGGGEPVDFRDRLTKKKKGKSSGDPTAFINHINSLMGVSNANVSAQADPNSGPAGVDNYDARIKEQDDALDKANASITTTNDLYKKRYESQNAITANQNKELITENALRNVVEEKRATTAKIVALEKELRDTSEATMAGAEKARVIREKLQDLASQERTQATFLASTYDKQRAILSTIKDLKVTIASTDAEISAANAKIAADESASYQRQMSLLQAKNDYQTQLLNSGYTYQDELAANAVTAASHNPEGSEDYTEELNRLNDQSLALKTQRDLNIENAHSIDLAKDAFAGLSDSLDTVKQRYEDGNLTLKEYLSNLELARTTALNASKYYSGISGADDLSNQSAKMAAQLGQQEVEAIREANEKAIEASKKAGEEVANSFTSAFMQAIKKSKSLTQTLTDLLKNEAEKQLEGVMKSSIETIYRKALPAKQAKVPNGIDAPEVKFSSAVDVFWQAVQAFTGRSGTSPGGTGTSTGLTLGGTTALNVAGQFGVAGAKAAISSIIPFTDTLGSTLGSGSKVSDIQRADTISSTTVSALSQVIKPTNSTAGAVVDALQSTVQLGSTIEKAAKVSGGFSRALGAAAPWLGLVGSAISLFSMFGGHKQTPSSSEKPRIEAALRSFKNTKSEYTDQEGLRNLLGTTTMQAAGLRAEGANGASGAAPVIVNIHPGAIQANGVQDANEFSKTVLAHIASEVSWSQQATGLRRVS